MLNWEADKEGVKQNAIKLLTDVKCWTVSGPKQDKWKWTPQSAACGDGEANGATRLRDGKDLLGVDPAIARSRIGTPTAGGWTGSPSG